MQENTNERQRWGEDQVFFRDFPGGSVVRTPHIHYRGPSSHEPPSIVHQGTFSFRFSPLNVFLSFIKQCHLYFEMVVL